MIHTLYESDNKDLSALEALENDYLIDFGTRRTDISKYIQDIWTPISYSKRKIKGANCEHYCFIDAFENPNIEIININGAAGSGKTFMPIGCALEDIKDGKYEKLVIVRERVPATKWPMGFLPGNLQRKIKPVFVAVEDCIDSLAKTTQGLFKQDPDSELELLVAAGKIEFQTLETWRGRNMRDCVILLDDAQNLSVDNIRLIVTRMSENCKLILGGDRSQVDDNRLEVLGMDYLHDVMNGSSRYCSLTFTHSELRSGLVAEFLQREKELKNSKHY